MLIEKNIRHNDVCFRLVVSRCPGFPSAWPVSSCYKFSQPTEPILPNGMMRVCVNQVSGDECPDSVVARKSYLSMVTNSYLVTLATRGSRLINRPLSVSQSVSSVSQSQGGRLSLQASHPPAPAHLPTSQTTPNQSPRINAPCAGGRPPRIGAAPVTLCSRNQALPGNLALPRSPRYSITVLTERSPC